MKKREARCNFTIRAPRPASLVSLGGGPAAPPAPVPIQVPDVVWTLPQFQRIPSVKDPAFADWNGRPMFGNLKHHNMAPWKESMIGFKSQAFYWQQIFDFDLCVFPENIQSATLAQQMEHYLVKVLRNKTSAKSREDHSSPGVIRSVFSVFKRFHSLSGLGDLTLLVIPTRFPWSTSILIIALIIITNPSTRFQWSTSSSNSGTSCGPFRSRRL